MSKWSEWSGCGVDCQTKEEWRTRECLESGAVNACFGLLREVRECVCDRVKLTGLEKLLGEGVMMPERFTVVHLVVACSLTFMMGSAVVLGKLEFFVCCLFVLGGYL